MGGGWFYLVAAAFSGCVLPPFPRAALSPPSLGPLSLALPLRLALERAGGDRSQQDGHIGGGGGARGAVRGPGASGIHMLGKSELRHVVDFVYARVR